MIGLGDRPISELRLIFAQSHPDLEKICSDETVRGAVILLDKSGRYDMLQTPISFYEAKGTDTRNGNSWRLGFFRSQAQADARVVEEIRLDRDLKLRFRRYFVVTHEFKD